MVSKHNVCSIYDSINMLIPISYSAWHRTHHKTSDTIYDPHSPKWMTYFDIVFKTHSHKFNVKKAGSRLRNEWQLLLTKNETPFGFYV